MDIDPLICFMTSMPHFVTGLETVLPVRLPLALTVPLCRLEKMHPFLQVDAACARSGLDFCAHSARWPGALVQGRKKALTLQV